ncbi:MAG: response regulator, partial [Rubrivivax sp.]
SDMLDMSRMDLGKLHLELEPVDLTELVRDSLDVLESLLREKSLQPSLEVSGTPQPLMADRARLQQVLWNLLTNAVKFSEPGGRLTVLLRHGDTAATITVRDEGQGIKPEFLPHLFDRFSQSDAATNRRHGGLGLGLSIVQQLAELHGGSVTAHSEGLGHGAAFVVTLPTRRGQPAAVAPLFSDSEQARHIEPLNLAHLAIVVVEDDADAREILGMILQNHGAAVRLATGYEQALALIDEAMPDVLVSDIGMPGKDGYDLIREIRQREQAAGAPRLPAIALTAFARAQDVDTAIAHGFDVHCAKPLRVHDLLATILRIADPAGRPTPV